MFGGGSTRVGVVLSVLLVIGSGFAVLTMVPHGTASGAGPSTGLVPRPTSPAQVVHSGALPTGLASPAAAARSFASPSDPASLAAHAALAAAKSAGVNARDVFVPRASASPADIAASVRDAHVVPLYSGSPAPMGVADFGLSAEPNGTVVPSVLQTSSLEGTVNASATGIWGGDLFQSSPDSFGIQLNAVTTNVTLFGIGGYEFWTQDVVEFFPASGFMVLVTNVWNFSDPTSQLSANAFFQHGPHGEQVGTTFYFAELVLPVALSYPLTINLTMTSNTTPDSHTGAARDSVYFSVGLSGPSVTTNFGHALTIPYDYVIFNSTPAGNPHKVVAASKYTANGQSYNPLGLTNDFELILGGPGGGSHVDITRADAKLGLDYWNGASYVPVPSALNYGGETGETASGVTVGWSDAAGGPAGFPTYANLTDGPSLLHGLWNASAPDGTSPVELALTPSNAFVLVRADDQNNLTVPEPEITAGALDGTIFLAPGNYTFTAELSEYTPLVAEVEIGPGLNVVTMTLAANSSEGIYTPLWATANSQLAGISTGGLGTALSPYRLFTAGSASLLSQFGLYNDFGFPVFPGIYLRNTTANVVIANEPSFSVPTNDSQGPARLLPATNEPQDWFWNVSNVAIANSTFSGGWFSGYTFAPISFDTFNVIFYLSTNNLVWNDTFATPTQALLMFQGGAFFGPSTGGGGGNVIWGSTFYQTAPPGPCPAHPRCYPQISYDFGLGLETAEGNDTIFNNWFGNPTTSWELPLNLYSGNPLFYTNAYNITPGSTFPTLGNFPQFPFTGPNIRGGANQSGNFWWDYGSTLNPYNGADNPLGALPYVENATTLLAQVLGCVSFYCATYLYPGGDHAPLTNGLVVQQLRAAGIPRFAPWGLLVGLSNPRLPTETGAQGLVGGLTSLLIAPGTYPVGAAFVGQLLRAPTALTVSSGLPVVLHFATSPGFGYLFFRAAGLPHLAGSGGFGFTVPTWSSVVEVAPFQFAQLFSNLPAIAWLLPFGMYNFTIPGIPNFAQTPTFGAVSLGGTMSVPVHFSLRLYAVTFTESGLRTGTSWSVLVNGTVYGHARRFAGHSTSPTITLMLPNGTFHYAVHAVRGYTMSPNGSGTLVVSNGSHPSVVVFTPVTYTVTFTESGLTAGTNWSITIGATTVTSNTTTIVFSLTNGSYPYTIGAVVGKHGSGVPASPFHVVGGPVAVAVTYR